MFEPAPAASIIVPTFREAANLESLIERCFQATQAAAIQAELIIVDDNSNDGTEEVIEKFVDRYPVKLVIRKGKRGLATAVLTGFSHAVGEKFVVLDADLQHPPEMIPALLQALDDDQCDFALGSRYAQGGGIEESWPWYRRLTSRVATLLANPLAPLADPMSGFFAIKRKTWEEAAHLNPLGYKIALELYVKGRCTRPIEIPIRFATRRAGESKLNVSQQIQYARHLLGLFKFRFPRAYRLTSAMLLITIAGAMIIISKPLWRAS